MKTLTPQQRELLDYYKSSASNYSKYSQARASRTGPNISGAEAAAQTATAADAPPSLPGTPSEVDPPTDIAEAATPTEHPSQLEVREAIAKTAGAATGNYMEFLKLGKELHRSHQKSSESISSLIQSRRDTMATLTRLRTGASETLATLSASTEWNLQGKFSVHSLIQEAGLKLQPLQLYDLDRQPILRELEDAAAHLTALRQQGGTGARWAPLGEAIDGAYRRLVAVIDLVRESNLESREMASLLGGVVSELEHRAALESPAERTDADDTALANALADDEQLRLEREQAHDAGEMAILERHTDACIALGERMMALIVSKLATLQAVFEDVRDLQTVNEANLKAAADALEAGRARCETLKALCAEDLKKVYALRRGVEDTERKVAAVVDSQVAASDKALLENTAETARVFAEMEKLERELEALEAARWRIVKQKVEEKERDEHRQSEYAHFVSVCDAHAAALNNTYRNADTHVAGLGIIFDATRALAMSVAEGHANDIESATGDTLETHKMHRHVFDRMWSMTSDQVAHRNAKRAELLAQVQAATIQQKLAIETYNPSAKKFAQTVQQLTAERADLEEEVRSLEARGAAAREQFDSLSVAPLISAGVQFVHPVDAQEARQLEHRARMVEYRALTQLGALDSRPLASELDDIRTALASHPGRSHGGMSASMGVTTLPPAVTMSHSQTQRPSSATSPNVPVRLPAV